MLIESIGEGVKKIDRLTQGLLYDKFPNTPWKEIMGLRDHIAHGYFSLDAEIIFDVVKTEIPSLQTTLTDLKNLIQSVKSWRLIASSDNRYNNKRIRELFFLTI